MEFKISEIEGKRVTVLGAGRSGLAVARLLSERGVHVFLSEQDTLEHKQEEAKTLAAAGISSEFGGHSYQALDADLCVVSPGISMSSAIVKQARKRGILVFGELEVASWFCEAPIVAVTGSNGKSTTTALMGEVFRRAGRPCVVAGNIGQPFSDYAGETGTEGVAVLEVSSFQLETIQYFRPKISVFLNLSPDHLDRHGSMENYGRLKSRIFQNQTGSDYLVFNGADRQVSKLADKARSQCIAFGVEKKSGRCGFVREGILTLRLGEEDEMVLPVSEMRIRGDHNVSNALGVALAARLMNVDMDSIRNAFRNFAGLAHRMEIVRTVDGIKWVNDSKATNVDSVWYALGSFPDPVVLIAGGRDKDSDFTLLKDRIREKTRGVILLGEATGKMERTFLGVRPLVNVSSLREAVEKAREMAKPGDVVLLSPGCASFDMFRDFEDRGEQFKDLVRQL